MVVRVLHEAKAIDRVYDMGLKEDAISDHNYRMSKMHRGHLKLKRCVKYVHELRNQTSSPRTCEPVHPRFSPVLHGLHGTVRPGFATVIPDMIQ